MKLILEVELGNDAMQSVHDVNLAVQRSLSKFAMANDGFDMKLDEGDGSTVVDENGNRVGTWVVST